jgi:uncharacterized protein (TIGR02996 family)
MDSEAFLEEMRKHPEDAATPLVYADWLDEQGDAARADFLRVQAAALDYGHCAELDELVARLRALAEGLPEEWLAVVSRPRLTATVWAGAAAKGAYYIFRYGKAGSLCYSSASGTFTNGTWSQVGPLVRMEMNNHYADYEGVMACGRIVGKAWNVVGREWRWDVSRMTEGRARRGAPYRNRLRTELPPLRRRRKTGPPDETAGAE